MPEYRKIKQQLIADEVMMGSIKLRQAIPVHGLEQISPFILLHHFDFEMKPGDDSFNVPPHPHRGFCPITFMFEGSVEHNDSLGNNKVISDNEVQWINAGRGIIHSEKANKAFVEKGGRYQGIQLWINIPASQKMLPASYQPLTSNEIVLITKPGAELRLVSGIYNDKKGPADSAVFTATLRMKPGSIFDFTFPEKDNVAFYVLEGNIKINKDVTVGKHGLIVFENSNGQIMIDAEKEAKLLLLSGTPIDEKIVSHGPFVMNSETEILEAMRDYKQGKMGFLY